MLSIFPLSQMFQHGVIVGYYNDECSSLLYNIITIISLLFCTLGHYINHRKNNWKHFPLVSHHQNICSL